MTENSSNQHRSSSRKLAFGLAVRQIRTFRKISIQQAATVTGISTNKLTRIESGSVEVSLNTAWNLAVALTVDPSVLLQVAELIDDAQIDLSRTTLPTSLARDIAALITADPEAAAATVRDRIYR
jgi:transcriptional regulator with XRE-family HTH domain